MRESDTTISGLNLFIDLISALICFKTVKEARNGPGFAAVSRKSIVPSGFTWKPIGGASISGNLSFLM
jgi:hypothetical protein